MSTTLDKKEEQLMWECYRELYEKATPSGNFDKLIENATINEHGEKVIPHNDYEIDDALFREIIEKYMVQIKPKWKSLRFKNTIFLGCSPRTINRK
jgi:hypothetical protein